MTPIDRGNSIKCSSRFAGIGNSIFKLKGITNNDNDILMLLHHTFDNLIQV